MDYLKENYVHEKTMVFTPSLIGFLPHRFSLQPILAPLCLVIQVFAGT